MTGINTGSIDPLRPGEIAVQLIDSLSISRLLTLDDLWSAYLDPDFPRGDVDYDGLIRLGGFIDNGIVEVSGAAERFEQVFQRYGDADFFAAVGSLASQGAQMGTRFPWLGNVEDDPNALSSLRDDVIASCQYVRQETEAELEHLNAKIELLRNGGVPDPDLRPLFRCAVALMGVGAGLALTIVTAPVGVPAVLLAGLGTVRYESELVMKWEKTGCKEVDLRHAFRKT